MAKVLTLDMSREDWKHIPGFEGLYLVSKNGEVFSVPRNGTKGGLLKQYTDRYGYKKVVIYKNNKPHYRTVHRLVAEAFISNPKNLKTVNHKDGNKLNNHVDNLEWMSVEDNMKHSFKRGLQRIQNQPIIATRLSDEKNIRFFSQKETARKLGIHQRSIWRAMKQQRPLHGYYFIRESDLIGEKCPRNV